MFDHLKNKIIRGDRFDFSDGVGLYKMPLSELGYLANYANKLKNDKKVYYNKNLHLNHTNICAQKCKFCSFYRDKNDKDAYTMDIDFIKKNISKYDVSEIDEVHIVGGLNPDLPFSYYEELMSTVKTSISGVKVKAFTAVEIDFFAKKFRKSYSEILELLSAAGLDSMPGGGAEVFAERARNIICPGKLSGEKWLEIHKIAHQHGIKTNATMLYGHVETNEERVEHLIKLRELQDLTGGFQAFIPLAYHPVNNEIEKKYYTTGQEDLKQIAVSRLMLDNFKNIKAYWVMLTPAVAQTALSFGANDIDGTIHEERITDAAGSKSGRGIGEDDLINLIKSAGYNPVKRDTLYNELVSTLC
ncbi:MAG: aminofutalosine synthase MqnE [Candidatus Delongbacteria bacterium]|nr:aminofutalosine synthase MqnE [Candidatus Delongbacteria bacterium]MBN2836557.1 aminofutalosine synthase MqnE [Candidatus Delongbacteria bacterium]